MKIPQQLYSCDICREDYSWPASDLFWSEKGQTWYCTECWSGEHYGPRGESLQSVLDKQAIEQRKQIIRDTLLEAAEIARNKFIYRTTGSLQKMAGDSIAEAILNRAKEI